jgi:hypothetical protein
LTDAQLAAINRKRAALHNALPPIAAEVLFFGKHLYESRCLRDGYTIEDVVCQMTSAIDPAAVLVDSPTFAAIQNWTPREDGYGNRVRDRAVFESQSFTPLRQRGTTSSPKKVKAALGAALYLYFSGSTGYQVLSDSPTAT